MLNIRQPKLKRNITVYYINSILGGLLFTVPIWVAFHLKYLSYSQMATLAALAYLVTLLLELPTGALADLIGRKKTIIGGQIFTGIFRIFLGFAINPIMFYIGWFGEAIGSALISGSDTALLYDSLKEEGEERLYPQIVSKGALYRRITLAVAVFLGSTLYDVFSGLPFILRGSAYVLMAFSSMFFTEPRIDTFKFTMQNYILQTRNGIKQLLRNSHLKYITFYYTISVGIIWVCQDYFVNTFARDSGFTESEQSVLFAVLYLLSTLIILFLTRNKDKIPSKKSVYIALPILLVISLIPGFFANRFLVFFLILGINTSSAIKGALLDNYVNEEIESKYRATAMSALNLLVSGIYMIALLSTGKIQDLYSNKLVWSILGLIAFVLLTPSTIGLVKTLKKSTKG